MKIYMSRAEEKKRTQHVNNASTLNVTKVEDMIRDHKGCMALCKASC